VSNLRYLARALAFLPPILLLASAIGAISCKSPLSTSSSSGSASPTSTSTVTGGGFAYVTNSGSGYVTEFKRNITTGFLKYNTRVAAGAASGTSGPRGIAITSNNSFLYVTNVNDNNIYQFTVGSDGTLSPMTPPSVANGSGTLPQQIVTLTLNSTPTWAFVSNYGAGTIGVYPITSAGPLGTKVANSAIAGLSGPFGLALNSTGTILYVSDNARGTIYALAFNSKTGALANITSSLPTSPVPSGSTFGSPGFLALGPIIGSGSGSGAYLLAGDTNPANVTLSMFFIVNSGNGVPAYSSSAAPASNAAIGVAWAGSVGGLPIALSANNGTGAAGSGSITSYVVNGTLLSPSTSVLPVNGPISIIVDSQLLHAYSTDLGDGTINQYNLNVVCQAGGTVQTICPAIRVVKSDLKISNPGPYGMVLTN